jgi:hypothetical protein
MIGHMSESHGWLKNIFQGQSPEHRSDSNDVNDKIATRATSKVLFARWTVFLTFLEEAKANNGGSLTDDMKLDWLLFQILPPLNAKMMDPFLALIDTCLIGADVVELLKLSVSKWEEALGTGLDKFFYVLDEAQVTGKRYMGCFSDEDGENPRPVIRPIIRTLASIEVIPIVVSGTGFSLDHFTELLRSGVGKVISWKREYRTGDFTVQNVQLAYITSLLPPGFLASESGMALLSRLYVWLRGRYVTLKIYCQGTFSPALL